jgi:hypothetical protein
MMDVVINELSFIGDNCKIEEFLNVLLEIEKIKITLYKYVSFSLFPDLKHLIKDLKPDPKRLILSALNKAIPIEKYDNKYFAEDELSHGCSIACDKDEWVISYPSKPTWAYPRINGVYLSEQKQLNNISGVSHINILYNAHIDKILNNINKVDDFWSIKNDVFPKFVFCDDVEKQMTYYSANAFKDCLRKLCQIHSCKIKPKLSSKTSEQKYKSEYTFLFPDKVSRMCFKHNHITDNDVIYYDKDNDYIYIGSVKGHLPTYRDN